MAIKRLLVNTDGKILWNSTGALYMHAQQLSSVFIDPDSEVMVYWVPNVYLGEGRAYAELTLENPNNVAVTASITMTNDQGTTSSVSTQSISAYGILHQIIPLNFNENLIGSISIVLKANDWKDSAAYVISCDNGDWTENQGELLQLTVSDNRLTSDLETYYMYISNPNTVDVRCTIQYVTRSDMEDNYITAKQVVWIPALTQSKYIEQSLMNNTDYEGATTIIADASGYTSVTQTLQW